VKVDTALLRSAIENVLRKAVRYTERGSQVEVSLLADSVDERTIAIIEVADHGPGVPVNDLSNFSPVL
jgi:signal transduction histidine kinase